MDNNYVQFDSDQNLSSQYYVPDTNSKPVQFLIDRGWAKDKKQAYIIIITTAVLALFVAGVLFTRGGVDYTPAPPAPGEILPE